MWTMRLIRAAVIFAMGYFALAAQTLLFRDFLTAFEGNELGVGSFFGSWLLWVGLGALAARAARRLVARLTDRFELAAMLYVPTFLLQQWLIVHARWLGGVSAYEIYPFARMFAVSLAANAPISFLTGFLFTLACRWLSQAEGLPVARVYILETLGSFAGGVVVTLWLAGGVSAEAVFLGAALLLVLAAAGSQVARPGLSRRARVALLALPAALLVLLCSGFSGWWAERNNRAAWSRLLPAEEYRGSFVTAQAKYLYGQREGQFVVMSWGGVSEALPNTEHASEVLALSLAQHPAARNVLLIGPGSLSLCARFARLPQIQQLVWLHPDPDYPKALMGVLPEPYRAAAQRVAIPGVDVRQFLTQSARQYDVILLSLPDATTLVLNRYSTRQFFSLLKQRLAKGGIACMRISGGANYMGGELVYLGCSTAETLRSVFRRVVLKPGDESWLIASDSSRVTAAPAALRDRFAAVEGAAAVYPPDGLLSLYLPDRAAFQMGKYREAAAQVERQLLLNTDRRPKGLLFSLLLALRRAHLLSFARHVPILLVGGVWIAACPMVLYGLLRLVYLVRRPSAVPRRSGGASEPRPHLVPVFDSQFLIFSTGLSGMSLSIVLMFLYQSQFGSLFLHIGLISSLFMLGSCLGSLLSEQLLVKWGRLPRSWLAACLLAHLLLVLLIYLLPSHASRTVYAALFAAAGVFVGIYFPIGAHRLHVAGRPAAAAGANLETLDHLGGAAGAVLTGWLLLPVLGGWLALCLLGLLVAVNLVPAMVPSGWVRPPGSADRFDRLARPAGYTMAGVGAFVLIASQIVLAAQSGRQGRLLEAAAREMAGNAQLVLHQAERDDGTVLAYYTTAESSDEGGRFLFSTAHLAKGIYGYAGPIVLAAYVDRDGTLRDLRIIRSRETPAYIESVRGWLGQLPGRNLFEPAPFEGVDAVSGASMTSEAILQTLEGAGRRFAAEVLGLEARGARRRAPHSAGWLPDREFLCLAILMALAIALRRRPGVWTRRVFLLASLVLTGVLLNLQYSTQQVMALLSFQLPSSRLGGSFFLVLLVPVLVLLFGNVYCGYVCPFGALQELIGEFRPARLATDPEKRLWRYGRAVKYVLLLLVVVLFGLTRDYGVLSADPLITAFSSLRSRAVLMMATVVVALSLVYRRFWCRSLCPAGAFLALLCGARLLRKLRPRTGPARCDLGVRTASELDCLCCDRCRHEQPRVQA